MLGPYLLAGYLKKYKIPTYVFDTSILFLKNALKPSLIHHCGTRQVISQEKIIFLAHFAKACKRSNIDKLLKLSSAAKILSALSPGISFSLDEANFGFAINNIRRLQKAVELLAWTDVFFENQPFWRRISEKRDINIGVSVSFSAQLPFSLMLAKLIKSKFPDKEIFMGGAYFNNYEISPTEIINKFHCVDHIVIGNGETPLRNISLLKTTPNKIVKSVHGDTEYIPNFAGVLWNEYCIENGQRTIPFSLRTSCYYHKCAFCNGDKVDYRGSDITEEASIRKTIQRLLKTCRKYKITHVYFTDAALSPKVLSSVASLIGRQFYWGINTRIDSPFSLDFFKHLHENGCDILRVGMESCSQRVLDLMKKGTKAENYLPYFTLATAAGIKLHVYIMFGFPGECDCDRNETLYFLNATKQSIYSYSISIFHAIPGTQIYNAMTTFYRLKYQKTNIDINKLYYSENSYNNVCSYAEKTSALLSNSHSNRYCYSGRVFQNKHEPDMYLLKFFVKWHNKQSLVFLRHLFNSGAILGASPGKIWNLSINLLEDSCCLVYGNSEVASESSVICSKWGEKSPVTANYILQNNFSFSTKE